MPGAQFTSGIKIAVLTGLAAMATISSASANTVDRVVFQNQPVVFSQVVERGNDFKVILVASNVPFRVLIKNAIGDVRVDISNDANAGEQFGASATMPGPQSSCRHLSSFLESEIYTSETKTAARPGTHLQQAVQVTVRFNRNADPEFRIVPVTENQTEHSFPAPVCRN